MYLLFLKAEESLFQQTCKMFCDYFQSRIMLNRISEAEVHCILPWHSFQNQRFSNELVDIGWSLSGTSTKLFKALNLSNAQWLQH